MTGATKNDQGKPDYSLIPKVAMDLEAEALMVGQKKYGRYNYCVGMELSRIMSALLRHAFAYYNGEERDPVDGQHHLGAIRACTTMISRMQELGTLIDDRFVIKETQKCESTQNPTTETAKLPDSEILLEDNSQLSFDFSKTYEASDKQYSQSLTLKQLKKQT